MTAASTDKVRKKKSNFSTTLSSGINDVVATIPISSSSGLPSDTAITLTIDRVDANGVSTPTLMERVTGVVGTNQLTTATRGVEGTAQAHSAGAVVEDIWEAATWNDLCTAFLVNHAQTGAIKSGAVIEGSTAAYRYVLGVSALSADRVVTLPLLLSADAFVMADHIQTLKNKTLDTFYVNDLSADHKYNFLVPDLAASRDVTMPLLLSADTMVMGDHIQTLKNKRVNPRTDTVASSATPTINTDTTDIFTITALATAITSMTSGLTGTPVNGQKLIIRFKDDGTARAITWGTSFASRGATLPTTTVLGKYMYVGLIYNSTVPIWDCVAVVNEA